MADNVLPTIMAIFLRLSFLFDDLWRSRNYCRCHFVNLLLTVRTFKLCQPQSYRADMVDSRGLWHTRHYLVWIFALHSARLVSSQMLIVNKWSRLDSFFCTGFCWEMFSDFCFVLITNIDTKIYRYAMVDRTSCFNEFCLIFLSDVEPKKKKDGWPI